MHNLRFKKPCEKPEAVLHLKRLNINSEVNAMGTMSRNFIQTAYLNTPKVA